MSRMAGVASVALLLVLLGCLLMIEPWNGAAETNPQKEQSSWSFESLARAISL